ncbi:MAG: hypothetical protein PHX38_02395 [Sulfuricella sp.]|nr:hypothetical protein [Sulfuricella sp.]
MILNWFDATEAKKFGSSLARFYMERMPPDSDEKKTRTKGPEVIGKLLQQAVRFRAEHKLNIYKKAQVGNVFKWTLKDAGYDPVFVDQLTKELMLKL